MLSVVDRRLKHRRRVIVPHMVADHEVTTVMAESSGADSSVLQRSPPVRERCFGHITYPARKSHASLRAYSRSAPVSPEPVKGLLVDGKILVSCAKGILQESLETINEILERVFPPECQGRLAYLSGPSFAAEVAR